MFPLSIHKILKMLCVIPIRDYSFMNMAGYDMDQTYPLAVNGLERYDIIEKIIFIVF